MVMFEGMEIMKKNENVTGHVYTNLELEHLSHSGLVMAYRDLRRLRDNDSEAYDMLLQEFRTVVADLLVTQDILRDINKWLCGDTNNVLSREVLDKVYNYFKEPF